MMGDDKPETGYKSFILPMIKNTFTILLLFSIQSTMGQPEELEGFELIWKGPLEVNQNYIREIHNSVGGHFTVRDYYIGGAYQMVGEYLSVDPEIEDGDFLFFHTNGQISHKGSYKNGELVGDWFIYDRSGNIRKVVNYDFDIKEPDQPSHDEGEIGEQAAFAGKNLKVYLASETVYPPRPYKYNIQGKVYVQFRVNEDGIISNALVVRGLDKDLDKEALRVIRNMPDWNPARKDGVPVPMAVTCPVVFKVEN